MAESTVAWRRTARVATRSGALWGCLFGLTVASGALSYAATYKTQAQRDHLATLFATNGALAAINGPAREIQTVAGYLVWKSFMSLIVLGAVWGLLLATKVLRGEEDAGRWEILLAGQTTRRHATGEAIAGLGAGVMALWASTAVILVVVGRSSKVDVAAGPLLFFALALAVAPALFLAIGALASQLAATRRQAAGAAGGFLAACYAIRLVADSSPGLAGLRWASPLGWVEELRPVVHPQPLALLPLLALTAAVGAAAVRLAGRRDLGTAVIAERARRPGGPDSRRALGPTRLALRLTRGSVAGWSVALAGTSLMLGLIAKQGGGLLNSSPSITQVANRLRVGTAGARGYLGFTFLLVAALVAFVAAGQVTALREEESTGRLEHLLVRPVSRWTWIAGRAGVMAAAVIGCALVAGLFAWFGAARDHSGVGVLVLLGAGLNVVPPALCVAGVGVLAAGVRPRATTAVTYGLLSWSLLIEVIGGAGTSRWLLDTSVFHQMVPAPAVSPDWTTSVAMVLVAVACMLGGAVAFRRRDLAGE